MTSFNNIPPGISAEQFRRIGQRDILPTQVKASALPQDLLRNSSTTDGSFSFNNGVVTTLTVRYFSTLNADTRIATVPFMIAFYDADTLGAIDPGTNQIPFDTTTGDFDLYGPMAMPQYTVSGLPYWVDGSTNRYFATDGNDTVWKTALRNESGGAETVQYLFQSRIIQARGGAPTR